jgi:glycerol-3-phosphate acyltransferase PlsX
MSAELKKVFLRSAGTKLGYLLMKGGLDDFRGLFDQDKIGGAPFLGISHPVIKAHGSSNETAAMNAVRQAIEFCRSGLIEEIAGQVSFMTVGEK